MEQIKALLADKFSNIPKELIPTISFGLIAIAFVLIIITFVVCVIYINTQPKKNKKPIQPITRDEILNKKEETPPAPKMKHEELPAISGRLGEILTLWGLLKAGPLTKTFFQVLNIIKNSTYDIKWRYKLPCFMIVGANGSGKTTLLDNLNFENLSSEDSTVNSMWKIFKQGAVFEFPNIETSEDKASFWSFIGDLFVFIRPRRPLDGLIITLPADHLTSENINITHQAQEIFERIFQFQRDINFRLPIYVVVTKVDLIPGFQEFAHLQHDRSKQQIFGWSCPYALNTAFSAEWINEIFSTLDEGIRKALFYFSRKRNIDENLQKAILFENHFEKIKPVLSNYLLSMFRTHNPQDGLILRGVYFTGKQKPLALSPTGFIQVSALTPGVNVDASLNHLHNDDLYFVQDLFKDKIFKEGNIAYPLSTEAISMSKNEFRNKAIFAGSAIALSLGWFAGNSNLKSNINKYCQTITSVKKSLLKIQYLEDTLQSSHDQILINKEASNLLQNIPTVKMGNLFSFFVPQSWVSNLGNNIKSTMELVFDSIVVKAMYIDLNFNTKNILITSTSKAKQTSKKRDIFDISNFESFKNLQEFINHLQDIQKVSQEYNSLRTLKDGNNVVKITEALFKDKFEITEEMRKHIPNKKIMPPQFNLSDFKNNIESNFKNLFSAFIKDSLDSTVDKVLDNVVSDLDKLNNAGKNVKVPYTIQDLAKLYSKIQLIEDIFNNKNFQWIKGEKFCPSEDYTKLIEQIQSIEVINYENLRAILNLADSEFFRYKNALNSYKSQITGNLLNELSPSESLLNLKQELKILLDSPFISLVLAEHYTSEIPTDKMLLWDVKRLKELGELIDKYESFSETVPEGMRPNYFDLHKTIAKKCFYPTIKAIIGNAEILDDLPLGNSRTLNESAYKKQATNIRNVSIILPKIIKILDEIVYEDNQLDFGFSNLIISQYVLLLEKIDALFNLEKPYSTNASLFQDWDGNGNPKFLNMNNKSNVKQYLNAQFERIKFLAKDLASPVIDLLTIPAILEKIRDKSLINKWREIIDNVNDYETQKPGNSIAALEGFITENLTKVSLNNFDDKGEIQNISQDEGDYFLSTRSNVAKSLISRADTVQYDKAVAAYNNLNKFFNQNLANKFPFGNSDTEASLKDIETFISIYESINSSEYKILERNKDKKNINGEVFNFIKSMASVIPFLKLWIQQAQSSDPNSCPICFNVLLRPFPKMEAMTSSVIDRILAINNVGVKDNTNAVFFNNDKVTVTFGWIASADEMPNVNLSTGVVNIEGNQAQFSYSGRWAMFKLIEQHKMDKNIEYPNGIAVQFEVPIIAKNQNNAAMTSKMVFKITPLKKDGDKLTPLNWPIFPQACPNLYNETTAPISDNKAPSPLPGLDFSFDEKGV